jgi:hypothetical protein
VGSYGENYVYGMSPTYKDGDDAGTLLVSKVDPDTGIATRKDFPVLDVIPSKYLFGATGLYFVPKAYLWDFGDGTSSTEPSPVHTYNTIGYHKIVLSVKNNSGEWAYIKGVVEHLIGLGKVDFSGYPRVGDKPLSVSFTDHSLAPTGCFYTGMQWDFGDTYSATGLQPAPHKYMDYGSYNVGVSAALEKM